MKKKQSNIERFLSQSEEEKQAEITQAIGAKGRPLSPSDRKQFKKDQAELNARHRAKSPGRPVTGKGAQVISLSVERDLLKRADAAAKKEGITRATLVARGLRAVLS